MNNQRRKALRELADKAREIHEALDDIYGEEEEAFENMPENLQYDSERGEAAQEAMNAIDNARSEAEALIDSIEEATN